MTTAQILKEVKSLYNPEDAQFLQRFFKTGKGEYGEGDVFLGIRIPVVRKLTAKYKSIAIGQVEELLHSSFHEVRMLALLILVAQFKKANQAYQDQIYQLYLRNTKYINNWDLVDSSAAQIVGNFTMEKDKGRLKELAKSESVWEQRISIIATFAYIRKGDFVPTLKISKMLLNHKHDLIHKAVGWMLREVGNRDQEVEEEFLHQHYKKMPRTMLRYAIEKFPEELRKKYLKGEI